jgi:serine/threonine protein kinase
MKSAFSADYLQAAISSKSLVFATYTCGREVGLILSPVADGGDLGNYLQTILDTPGQRPAAEQEAVLQRTFGCLASGIASIHLQTIRHRDIKPQNILIHEGSMLYTGFGISLDASQDERTTTLGTALCMTFRYRAPEVARFVKNRKSDIYSLGCVLGGDTGGARTRDKPQRVRECAL